MSRGLFTFLLVAGVLSVLAVSPLARHSSAFRRKKHDDEVQFYAFDILVSEGDDLRNLPLTMRKGNLSRLLARRVDGIFLSDF